MAKGKSNVMGMIGFWAFVVGLVIAVVVGIMSALGMAGAGLMSAVIIILIILGLVVGFLNITAKEILLFLVATIALIVVGGVFAPLSTFGIGAMLDAILALIATLMAPAAIVAAIKALWAVGRPG
ncbi:MAG: hypothetical protein JSV54_06805 [Chloroflexota bacterium]|nr:MAG: hypothetical protein JSV54_06805 [Chloroflexota bacterium]